MSKSSVRVRWSESCHYCGIQMSHPMLNRPDSASVEHIVPKSHGGHRTESNIVMACRRCNGSRGNGPSPCGCKKCKMAYYLHYLRKNLVITDTRPPREIVREGLEYYKARQYTKENS